MYQTIRLPTAECCFGRHGWTGAGLRGSQRRDRSQLLRSLRKHQDHHSHPERGRTSTLLPPGGRTRLGGGSWGCGSWQREPLCLYQPSSSAGSEWQAELVEEEVLPLGLLQQQRLSADDTGKHQRQWLERGGRRWRIELLQNTLILINFLWYSTPRFLKNPF